MTRDDTDLTLQYLETLDSGLRNLDQLLRSARRWPWKRKDVPRLLYDSAHQRVLIGCNLVSIARIAEASDEFIRAAEQLRERISLLPITCAGHSDVQCVAAAFLANRPETGRDLAATLVSDFNPSLASTTLSATDREAVQKADFGTVALLSWVAGAAPEQVTAFAAEAEGARRPLVQFLLWARCAAAAATGDEASFRGSFGRLVQYVDRQIKRGEFAYTEDAQAYLPGLLIARVARDKGFALDLPSASGWPSSLWPAA